MAQEGSKEKVKIRRLCNFMKVHYWRTVSLEPPTPSYSSRKEKHMIHIELPRFDPTIPETGVMDKLVPTTWATLSCVLLCLIITLISC